MCSNNWCFYLYHLYACPLSISKCDKLVLHTTINQIKKCCISLNVLFEINLGRFRDKKLLKIKINFLIVKKLKNFKNLFKKIPYLIQYLSLFLNYHVPMTFWIALGFLKRNDWVVQNIREKNVMLDFHNIKNVQQWSKKNLLIKNNCLKFESLSNQFKS